MDYLAEWQRRYADTYELPAILRRVLSDSTPARTVQRWIARHARAGIGNGAPDALEELERLAAWMQLPAGVSPWQAAPAEWRSEHTARVARLARELADALEEPEGLPLPELPALLDPDKAPRVRLHGLCEQTVPALLRNLAAYAQRQAHPPAADPRPKSGPVVARTFVRNVAAPYFLASFGKQPPAVLAALVTLRFPGTRAEPETVRDWLRVRAR